MAVKSSRTKNSILNLMSGFVGQLLITFLRFATRTVFINTLGVAYLGINGLFSDILSMLALTELGIGTAMNYRLYKPLAENDEQRVRVLLKFYKQAYRAIGGVILMVGLCLLPFLHLLIKDYDNLAVLGINASLIFILYLLQNVSTYLFTAYRSTVMKAAQKNYVLDIVDGIFNIITYGVQMLILVLLRDFVIYTAIVIVFRILKNFVNAGIAMHYFPRFFIKEEESLCRDEVRTLFKDCGALFINKTDAVVTKATGNILLSAFLGLAVVGMYSNYLMLYNTLNNILNRFYSSINASVGNYFVTESMEKKYLFFKTMNFITVILYGTACAGLMVCTSEFIEVWVGKKMVVSELLAALVGIELLLNGIKLNLNQIRNVSGTFQQVWYIPLISALLNLLLSLVLVRVGGIHGVVVATIISLLATYFALEPEIIYRHVFLNFKPVREYYVKNILYFAILSAVSMIDKYICANVFTGHGWLSMIVHALFVGVSVPAVFIVIFWKSDECRYLAQVSGNLLKKIASIK